MKKKRSRTKASFSDIVGVMAKLRAPGGCPWDRKQTHRSLLKYLKEESAEVAGAVRRRDYDNLREELGDVLLQILFHADIAREAGRFDIYEVIGTLKSKLVRRHPHIFSRNKERLTPAEVHRRWNLIKKAEKAGRKPAKRRK